MVSPTCTVTRSISGDTPTKFACNFQLESAPPPAFSASIDGDDGLSEDAAPRRAWHLTSDEGAYRDVLAWTSREAWFDAVLDALATGHGEELRSRAKVKRETLLRVALQDRRSADPRSGRGVYTSHATVARAIGVKSPRTVKRARDLLVELGFAVVIVVGRHLNAAERIEAQATHGRSQNRAASLRALTMPRPSGSADQNVTPSRRDKFLRNSHLSESKKNHRAQARAGEYSTTGAGTTISRTWDPRKAAARPGKDGQGPSLPQPRRTFPVWDPTLFAFAKAFQTRMPALRRFHPATICKLLADAHIDPRRWHNADSLVSAMEHSNKTRGGWRFADPQQQRNPLAYTHHMLTLTVDPAAETPYEAYRRRRAELKAEQEQHRVAAAAERSRATQGGGRAAREFFQAQKRLYGRAGAAGAPTGGATTSRIVKALLTGPEALYERPLAAQLLVGDIQTMARALAKAGWTLAHAETGSQRVTWTHVDDAGTDVIHLTLSVAHEITFSSDAELDDILHSPGFPAHLLSALSGTKSCL
jgi:hypothetical protein